MEKPDQRLFEADLLSADFRAGVLKGFWDLAGADVLPEQPAWPVRILWMAAAPRTNAPERFYVQLDLSGYRSVPPTGTFWDPNTKSILEVRKRPKGKPDSRFARVFRTDTWPHSGSAFYHPYLSVSFPESRQVCPPSIDFDDLQFLLAINGGGNIHLAQIISTDGEELRECLPLILENPSIRNVVHFE